MAPFVDDDVVVILFRVGVEVAQQEQRVEIAAVKRCPQFSRIDIGRTRELVVNAPEGVERSEVGYGVGRQHELHRFVDRVEDRERTRCTRGVCRQQVLGVVGCARVEEGAFDHVNWS